MARLVDRADVARMTEATLLSYGPNSRSKLSKFWILLVLSAVIATAGVASDSTATVIGAMIVAPLMTPILGVAVALVLSDRKRMWRSLATVLGGALVVVLIAVAFGMVEPLDTITENNSQVSGRVNPRLVDLLAALATGLVGAFALARSDVSDTLPGVAIAISLVPPLAVVGFTLQEGHPEQAYGALLLFATNVTAIIFTATLVLLAYRVRDAAKVAGYPVGRLSGSTVATVVALILVVAVPLAIGSARVAEDNLVKYQAADITETWAEANGWKVVSYDVADLVLSVTAIGAPPELSPQTLREELDEAGFTEVDLTVSLVVGGQEQLPGVP